MPSPGSNRLRGLRAPVLGLARPLEPPRMLMTPINLPFALVFLLMTARAFAGEVMTVPGPQGPLQGEAILVPGATAGIIIIPGSGPTDRDGNGPAGIRSDSYKLLAEGLAKAGLSTLRIDKRGFFGSSKAIANPEDVTIANYAHDVGAWHDAFAERMGTGCVWIAGHSEGGLVALVAAASGVKACGLILLSTPGRRISDLMREQLRHNPLNGPYLDELDRILSGLERGEMHDVATISAPLQPLFREGLQRYMIGLFSYDPKEVANEITLPALIVQGDKDVQVTKVDAQRLAGALPQAKLVEMPGVTHMLKQDVAGAPLATYRNPELPLDPNVVPTIADFVKSASRAERDG